MSEIWAVTAVEVVTEQVGKVRLIKTGPGYGQMFLHVTAEELPGYTLGRQCEISVKFAEPESAQ